MNTTTTRRSGRIRALVASIAVAGALAAGSVFAGAPANAVSSIAPPAGLSCNSSTRTLQISVPRIWATSRTEQVLWTNTVQRLNTANNTWYTYGTYYNMASVNTFGQVVNSQGWTGIGGGTLYGSPINSQLHIRVSHPGYYRVFAAIAGNQGGAQLGQWVAGGAYCTFK